MAKSPSPVPTNRAEESQVPDDDGITEAEIREWVKDEVEIAFDRLLDELVTAPDEPGHAAQSQAAIQSVIGAVARVSK